MAVCAYTEARKTKNETPAARPNHQDPRPAPTRKTSGETSLQSYNQIPMQRRVDFQEIQKEKVSSQNDMQVCMCRPTGETKKGDKPPPAEKRGGRGGHYIILGLEVKPAPLLPVCHVAPKRRTSDAHTPILVRIVSFEHQESRKLEWTKKEKTFKTHAWLFVVVVIITAMPLSRNLETPPTPITP